MSEFEQRQGLEITDSTFFVVESEDGRYAYDTRLSAVDGLTEVVGVGNIAGNENDFEIIEVEIGEDDGGKTEWRFGPVDWKAVSRALMADRMESGSNGDSE